MTPQVWRHVQSSGPYPWQPALDYSVEEIAPGQFAYLYRRCECPTFWFDPRFYRPETRAAR